MKAIVLVNSSSNPWTDESQQLHARAESFFPAALFGPFIPSHCISCGNQNLAMAGIYVHFSPLHNMSIRSHVLYQLLESSDYDGSRNNNALVDLFFR